MKGGSSLDLLLKSVGRRHSFPLRPDSSVISAPVIGEQMLLETLDGQKIGRVGASHVVLGT